MKRLENGIGIVVSVILMVLFVLNVKLKGDDVRDKVKHMIWMKAVIVDYHYKKNSKRFKVNPKSLFNRLKKPVNKAKILKSISRRDIEEIRAIHIVMSSYHPRKSIIKSIIKESKRYRVPTDILAYVLFNESSLNKSVKHDPVIVKVGKKKIKTRAIGLGGVIWETNKTLLRREGILSKRELYSIRINIKASAVILSHYISMKRVAGARNRVESGLMRYFGLIKRGKVYSRIYPKRIYKLMREYSI